MSVVWEAPMPSMIWAIHSPLEQLADPAVTEPLPPAGRTAPENESKVLAISFPHPTIMYTVSESQWPRRAFGLSPDARADERIARPGQAFGIDTQTGSSREGG